MRPFLLFISFLVFSGYLFAQKDKKKKHEYFQYDTTFTIVPLLDIHYAKTLVIDVGKKAKIFLPGDSIMNEAKEYSLSEGFDQNNYRLITAFLDSAYRRSDTVTVEFYKLENLEYLVARQLMNGNAKVFYKRQNTFIDSILHRRERFGGHGDRFFYLPDNRAFFGVMEISGIIDNDALFSGKYFQDYAKEGEKFASLRQE